VLANTVSETQFWAAAETKSKGLSDEQAIVRSHSKDWEGRITRSPAEKSVSSAGCAKVTVRWLENQQPIWAISTERLQYNFQLTQDELIRDAMASTTSLVNATGGLNGDNPTNMTSQDLMAINAQLLDNNAMKFTRGIQGTLEFNTSPIAASYLGLGHTNLLSQLYGLSGWVPSHQYSNLTPVFPAEAGYNSYFRFCLSSVGLIEQGASALGQDVYDVFMVAREAVGDVELAGYGVQLIYASPEVTEPRFRTAASLAVKWSQAPTILNDAWIIKYRCTLAT
jgi:N4-gp56 family major capsid protein